MRYAWFVVTLLAARFIVTAVAYPPPDGNLAWQRWLGAEILRSGHIPRTLGLETYTAAGAPWLPQEWLFGIAAASVSPPLFAFFVAACALAAILLTAYRAVRRGAQAPGAAVVAALTGTAMLDAFAVRAQVVAWPLFALLFLAIDEEGPWLWAAVPIAALWSNVHASAIFAPFLVGMVACGRLLEDRLPTPRVRRAFLVTLAVAAAICCNPFGIGLPLYALSLSASPVTAYISEWRPSDLGLYGFALGALPLLAAIVIFGAARRGEKRVRVEDMLALAAFTFLLFFAARNTALFAIAQAPLAGAAMGELFPETRKASHKKALAFLLPVFIGIMAFVIGVKIHASKDRLQAMIPRKEITALLETPGEHRVFCANYAWSSYFLGSANVRVFLDGRSDPYPARVWKDFANIAFLQPGWYDVLTAYRVDAVLDERRAPIDQAMALTQGWRDASHDERYRLWVRL